MQLIVHHAAHRQILDYHELQWLRSLDAARHPHLSQLLQQPRGSFNAPQLADAVDEVLACLAAVGDDTVQRRSGLRLLLAFAAAHRAGQAATWQIR